MHDWLDYFGYYGWFWFQLVLVMFCGGIRWCQNGYWKDFNFMVDVVLNWLSLEIFWVMIPLVILLLLTRKMWIEHSLFWSCYWCHSMGEPLCQWFSLPEVGKELSYVSLIMLVLSELLILYSILIMWVLALQLEVVSLWRFCAGWFMPHLWVCSCGCMIVHVGLALFLLLGFSICRRGSSSQWAPTHKVVSRKTHVGVSNQVIT